MSQPEAEAEAEEAEEGDELNLERVPLAPLFKDRTDVDGHEIRLTFKRNGAVVDRSRGMSRAGKTRLRSCTARSSSTNGYWRTRRIVLRQPSKKPQTQTADSFKPCVPSQTHHSGRKSALPDSQRHRMAAPLPEYRQHTTSTGLASVPQLDVPLPSSRPEAFSSSFSNNKELEIHAEAWKQEFYRQKVEQTGVEREAYRKWQEEAQKLREVREVFVMDSGSSSMDKRRKPGC